MEESTSSSALGGKIIGITFSLATPTEICKSSVSDCSITHASQLSNPFLGLPLEVGKCESCGTSEPGQCEGHFGYIELPIPIYHPDHVGELKRMLSLLCLKCLKLKNRKIQTKTVGVIERMFSCCEEASQVTVDEVKTEDGACYLMLKVPSRKRVEENFWNFLGKYGFLYGTKNRRPLLPSEVMVILRKIPGDTRKKLSAKGYFPQEGYILQYLPVPPNCLSVPDISDGTNIMSRDHSISLLKKVLHKVENIKHSRSGMPNFESHQIEANDLQADVAQYFQFRGTGKASRDVDSRFGVHKDSNTSSTKAWLEKMKTLFIRKSSGFSSRSVITGDPYIGVNEIGLPMEIAQKITFEERVSQHNMNYLQKLVDEKLCLTYRDGMSTYSLREGSKGHTFLRLGQVVHRRIMNGDMVFINRPPTTHKHSLQGLSVYIHDDHTVKINPLICGPLSADFDGDCIHLFYPQSLAARAEVFELFSVEKQLLSSHTGNFNLQLATDSLLSLKLMFRKYFFGRINAQQLMMFARPLFPKPAVVKYSRAGSLWTVLQMLQAALPPSFGCSGERYLTHKNELVKFDFNRDLVQSTFTDIVTSILFSKGPKEVVSFFNSLTPLLMESLHSEGFSVCLEDFYIPKAFIEHVQESLTKISPLLYQIRSSHSESLQLEMNNYLRGVRLDVSNMLLKSSAVGFLIDSKSESALSKVVQQIGFLGMQLSDKGQFYSKTLLCDIGLLFQRKYPSSDNYPSEEFGLVRSCLFHGLDPYQEMVHSISSREVIVRSSRGLTEPGTLFKNLMAILRDVVICYDGTVRNVCANSVIQFEYGTNEYTFNNEFVAGEPVGVLAATAMSNPAYKAVLDSSPSSNSSWEMMKEILLCPVNFKNDVSDRRVILYLKDCGCGRKYCRENAAYAVKNQLKKVNLKDAATELLIEYREQLLDDSSDVDNGLVGHIHLDKALMKSSNITMNEILSKCEDMISSLQKRKKTAPLFRKVTVQVSESCSFQQSSKSNSMPCLTILQGTTGGDHLEQRSHDLAEEICPPILETVIKGDPRVSTVDIIWVNPDAPTWIRSPCRSQKGELALDVVLEKHSVKQTGDSWRILMDSCLPVMHLIDTDRSIPYAIKQVQELLGISCAFEQAVQRLSTSVMMVTRGVLKDHLVLLANSMTYSGNLIGFNIGGIKALSNSLNVQVPFMEATLSAPRKCFERAAEKRHVDSLSSVVGSCSWGKQVAVGTGSAFDILLDTRKVELSEADGLDVYDFLQLVRGGSSGEETSTACLGAEVENLDLDDEVMGYDLSPVRDSGKPTFEDTLELDDRFANELCHAGDSGDRDWTRHAPQTAASSGGWEQAKKGQSNGGTTASSDSAWSAWGNAAVGEETSLSNIVKQDSQSQWNAEETEKGWKQSGSSVRGKKIGSDSDLSNVVKGSCKWDATSYKAQGNGIGGEASNTTWSSWGPAAAEAFEPNSSKHGEWSTEEPLSISKKLESSDSQSQWNAKETENSLKLSGSSAWGKKTGSDSELMNAVKGSCKWEAASNKAQGDGIGEAASHATWSSWGPVAVEQNSSKYDEWGTEEPPCKQVGSSDSLSQWNAGRTEKSWKQSGSSAMEKKTGSDSDSLHAVKGSCKWEAASDKAPGNAKGGAATWSNWEPVAPEVLEQKSSKYGEWGTEKPPSGKQSGTASAWGNSFDSEQNSPSTVKPVGGWDKKIDKGQTGGAHGAASGSGGSSWGGVQVSKEDSLFNKVLQSSPNHDECGTEETQSIDKQSGQSSAWRQKVEEVSGRNSDHTWGGKREAQSQWGRKWSKGDASHGEWKNKRNYPNKAVDNSKASGIFTLTKQRLDLFTAEEEDVLSDAEQMMQNIRRIMHQSGYNDGDPLSADDQSYIADNVLNYHPDKALKIGAGIQYIMVSKHVNFQDTRCFYVVSTDEHKQDFSYRKSLENFIRGKYPDKAEAFLAKYFRKPQPRPGWTREPTTPSTEAAGAKAEQ